MVNAGPMSTALAEQALTYPVNTIHRPNVDSILRQQRRQWSNIDPTLAVYRFDRVDVS